MARDDFSREVKERLAKRVGMRCSNPDCRQPTSGPDSATGVVNIGVAAHISAASPGGARYNSDLSPQERSDISNAIWLCQDDAKRVDDDEIGYPVSLLFQWRETAVHMAALEQQGFVVRRGRSLADLEARMRELFAEIRKDIKSHPFARNAFLRHRKFAYNNRPDFKLVYYHEDHSDLTEKFVILRNYGAVFDHRSDRIEKFEFTEDFVEYLGRGSHSET